MPPEHCKQISHALFSALGIMHANPLPTQRSSENSRKINTMEKLCMDFKCFALEVNVSFNLIFQ